MELTRPIHEMDVKELEALLDQVAPRGQILDGDIIERFVSPIQNRLKTLGFGADEKISTVTLD